jgi:hypothetical protein
MTKPGLKRLILINTHIKGKTAEIRLDGHANLSGANGAGKTSLLKLIAFFYGSEPSKLCPRIENKKSFVDYFLPFDKSYLVYEYASETGLQCVAVYRHSSGLKPAYRFIGSGFMPEAFYTIGEDRKTKAYSNDMLKRQCQLHQIPISRQIETVQDYRAILMNHRSVIDRCEDAAELRRLIPIYSLSPRRPLYHLEKVTEAALSSEGSLDRIKQIVANIMAEDGVAITSVTMSKDSLNLVEDITSLREIDRERPRLERVVSDSIALVETRQNIANCHRDLKWWEQEIKAQLDSKVREHSSNQEERTALNATWEERRDELNNSRSKLESEQSAVESEIEGIIERRDTFEASGIYAKQDKVKQISRLEEELKQATIRLEDLESKGRDAQHQFMSERSKLDAWKSKETASLQAELDANNDKEREITERENEAKASIKQLHREKERELVTRFNEERIALEKQQTAAKLRADQSYQTDEEGLQIAAAEEALNERETKKEEALQAHNAAERDAKDADTNFSLEREARRKAQTNLTEEEGKLAQIMAWAAPETGTLRAALQKQGESWTSTVAKVLRPELLDRKDLKPEFLCEDDKLYGWSLNLEAIAIPAYARSLEDLARQRDEQSRVVDVARQRLESAERSYEKAEQKLATAQGTLRDKERLLTSAISLQKSAKHALDIVRAQVRDAVFRRRQEARLEAKNIASQIEQLKSREHQAKEALAEQEQSAIAEAIGQFSTERSAVTQEKDGIIQRQSGLGKRYGERLKQLENDKRERLSAQGISKETLEAAEQEVSSLRQDISTYAGYRDEVAEFELFSTTSVRRLDELRPQLVTVKDMLREVKEKLFTEQAQFTQKKRALIQASTQIEKEMTALNNSKSTVDSLLLRLKGERVDGAHDFKPRSLDLLEQDIEAALSTKRDQERSIIEGVGRAENILSRRQKSPLYGAWQQACREVDTNGKEADVAVQKATALERLLRDSVPQVRASLLQQIRVTGIGLVNLYKSMEAVQKAVDYESNQISSSIKSLATAEALQDIELKLISRIDKLDYWDQLKRFKACWDEWAPHDDVLPPQDFEEVLGHTLRQLQLSKTDHSIEALFDIVLKVRENGNPATISTDRSMNGVSSTGLSLMFVSTIYAGITRLLCNKSNVQVHWPVDELARLDPNNAGRLVELLNSCGIVMVGGFPSTDESLTRIFVNKHIVEPGKGIVHFKLGDNPIENAIQRRNMKGAVSNV